MKKYLQGLIFVWLLMLIFCLTACSQRSSGDSGVPTAELTETISTETSQAGELNNTASEPTIEPQTDPQSTLKTEELLAPEEEILAAVSQGDLVAIIDRSLKTLIPQLDSLSVKLEKVGTAEPLAVDDLEQVALDIDQVKDQIDATGEQLEVFYFLYGEKQDDFIAFLYSLEEDMDSVLVSVISLSEIVNNDQYSGKDQSEALSEIADDMKIQLANLQLNVEDIITAYESSKNKE